MSEQYNTGVQLKATLLLVISCLLTPAVSSAQVGELAAKEIAANYVRELTSQDASDPLRVSRREDWEDDLFSIQLRIVGRIAKAAYFFEVTTDGTYVLSPDKAILRVSSHGTMRYVVAVSTSTGEAFALYGLPHPEIGFQLLAVRSDLRIESDYDASNFARLFFATVHDPTDSQVVYGERNLRRHVEDVYYSRRGDKGQRIAKRWWRGFKRVSMPVDWWASAAPRGDQSGFDVSITYLIGTIDRTLQLRAICIAVKPDGELEVAGDEVIFELP